MFLELRVTAVDKEYKVTLERQVNRDPKERWGQRVRLEETATQEEAEALD